jgi:hypothetical protein
MTPWIKFLHVIELILHSGDSTSTILQISSSVRALPFANLFALADASLIFLHVLQHGCCREFKKICAV